MTKRSKITLLGGDMRQYYVADFLSDYFDEVAIWGLGEKKTCTSSIKVYDTPQAALQESELSVLPVRVSLDGTTLNCPLEPNAKMELLYLLDIFSSNSTILGGIVSQETLSDITRRKHRYIGYLEREELQIKNALLTAEGALALGISETQTALLGSRVAVLGYGRIAKFLCEKLSHMGASVTVFARKSSDRATVLSCGFQAFSFDNQFSNRIAHDFDIIYNTIPAPIFDATTVSCISEQTTYIELASAPGGMTSDATRHLKGKFIRADGLPGKVAPKSAGEIIAETIVQILTEEEYFT